MAVAKALVTPYDSFVYIHVCPVQKNISLGLWPSIGVAFVCIFHVFASM